MIAHLGRFRLSTAEAISSVSMLQTPHPNNDRAQKELKGLLSNAVFQNSLDQIMIKPQYY